MNYMQKASLGDIKLLLGLVNAFSEDVGREGFAKKNDLQLMIVWRNLRNIGYVMQEQLKEEMEATRQQPVIVNQGLYQLESESEKEGEDEEVPRTKARRVTISKKNKR